MVSKTITGDILIGSASISPAERPLRAMNPATGDALDPAFAFAGEAEVARACGFRPGPPSTHIV